mmetsp:Transcript_11064/g.27205  ORF Transcript_11064/g.27205 Transcript_11064/m.27205 type:complete len:222 (+) Transcript_11064:2352-3017(+)
MVISIFLLLTLAVAIQCIVADDNLVVTCGSAIAIRHLESKKYFLKSSSHKFGASGQQVVSLDVQGSGGIMWQIQAAHNKTCTTGEPVTCGEVVRLTHVETSKNLHCQHGLPAPLSPYNNEVSGFGNEGVGDAFDNWRVECIQRKGAQQAKGQMWMSGGLVRFQHVESKRWLVSGTKTKFNQSNCPHCPIHGELEVSATNRNSDAATQSSIFRADDGAYLRQ